MLKIPLLVDPLISKTGMVTYYSDFFSGAGGSCAGVSGAGVTAGGSLGCKIK